MEGLNLDNIIGVIDNGELNIDNESDDITGIEPTEINKPIEEPAQKSFGIDEQALEGVDGNNQEENDAEDANNEIEKTNSQNIYSSIAKDLLEEGIITLDEKELENVSKAGDLSEIFKKQVDLLLDETQQRINEALYNQVPADTISHYEGTISELKSITKEQIEEEGENGESLRKQLIYGDYISKGFSKERAEREVKKSVDGGNDIEDAQDALNNLLGSYEKEYNDVIKSAKDSEAARIKAEKEQIENLKKKFFETEEPVKGIKLSKSEREKMYTKATAYIGKDSFNRPITELQKYANDNPIDFQYYLNVLFYQTNGFKDLSQVVSKEVKTQNKSAMKNLENVLKNQGHNIDSGLDFSNSQAPESFSSLGLKLNLN
jgi:hypothetical protein